MLFLVVVAGVTYALWPPDRRDGEKVVRQPALQVPSGKQPITGIYAAIRVNLTSVPVDAVEIQIDGPFRVQPVDNPLRLGEAEKLEATSVTVTKTGFQVGGTHYPVTRLEFHPRQSPAIWVNGHQYRGTLRLFRRPGRKLTAVNVLPLEQYVASVVDSEMPAAFPDEARQAQAVVARTYALYQMGQAPRDGLFDVYAGTRSQKYLGYQYRSAGRLLAGESTTSRQIVDETRGLVCIYGGRLFCTYYSAVCGGQTLQGTELFDDAAPAVASVPCDYCRDAKYYRWEASLSAEELRQKLSPILGSTSKSWGPVVSLNAVPPVVPGRLAEFDARYQGGHAMIRADRLRTALADAGVRSPSFRVERRGEFLIHGRGHGHGAGLCQWGARGQAQLGRTAEQILSYYYPGSEIVRIAPTVARN